VYDPDLPTLQNQAYIDKVKSLMPLQDAVLQGKANIQDLIDEQTGEKSPDA